MLLAQKIMSVARPAPAPSVPPRFSRVKFYAEHFMSAPEWHYYGGQTAYAAKHGIKLASLATALKILRDKAAPAKGPDFMTTQKPIVSSGALTPFSDAAQVAGLQSWALERLIPGGLRYAPPEHVVYDNGKVCCTVGGLRALATSAAKRGYYSIEHALNVLANQKESTPSRALIAPIAKNAAPHAWQQRVDCNG